MTTKNRKSNGEKNKNETKDYRHDIIVTACFNKNSENLPSLCIITFNNQR